MLIYIDIDNTICTTPNMLYEKATPIPERIEKINRLWEDGDTIVYWTARGTLTGDNHYQLTRDQLDSWGCKYDELRMGKPPFDLFIDDKNINSEDFFDACED